MSSSLLAILLTCALLVALLFLIAAASRHKKAAVSRLDLIGMVARAVTDLEPEGSVLIEGELWRARSRAGNFRRGARVRVVGSTGHLLEVEPDV